MKLFRLGLGTIVCLSLGLLTSTTAVAGFKTGQSVVIVDSAQMANGMLGQVRNSADTTQYIGCATWGVSWGSMGLCEATSSTGVHRACLTYDANMIAAIRALQSDSYLIFYWDSIGYCTSIEVETASDPPPKTP